MMNTCETCRYYMASPLQEPCESCHWDGVIGHDPPNWKGPTNADRIRGMTDEELANFLAIQQIGVVTAIYKAFDVPAPDAMTGATEEWLDWLKARVEE